MIICKRDCILLNSMAFFTCLVKGRGTACGGGIAVYCPINVPQLVCFDQFLEKLNFIMDIYLLCDIILKME